MCYVSDDRPPVLVNGGGRRLRGLLGEAPVPDPPETRVLLLRVSPRVLRRPGNRKAHGWVNALLCPPEQIFIFENNIYYCAHVGKQAIRVVSTGKEDVIYNGLSDWLYEGERQAAEERGPVVAGAVWALWLCECRGCHGCHGC